MRTTIRRIVDVRWRWGILAIPVLVFLSSCEDLGPSAAEGPPPGYISGEIPAQYKGLRSPFTSDDREVLEAGQRLYALYCLECHGEDGRGHGPEWPYLEPAPADFAAPPMLRAFREHQDYVFWWVSEGVLQTAMPAFQSRLSEVERWQVITYAWYLGEEAASSGDVSSRGVDLAVSFTVPEVSGEEPCCSRR